MKALKTWFENAWWSWGTYKDFVPFVEEILDACKEHPKANVRTWI